MAVRGLWWSQGWGSGSCAGVVAAAGREFLAARKIPHILFITPNTTDLVIMTQQDSSLGPGPVGGLWVSLQGPCGFLRSCPGDSGTSSDVVMAGCMAEISAYIVG